MVRSFHGFHSTCCCWCGLNPAHCYGPTSLICQLLSASCGDLVMRTTAAVSCLQRAPRAHNIVRGLSSSQLSGHGGRICSEWQPAVCLPEPRSILSNYCACVHTEYLQIYLDTTKVAMCPGLVTRDPWHRPAASAQWELTGSSLMRMWWPHVKSALHLWVIRGHLAQVAASGSSEDPDIYIRSCYNVTSHEVAKMHTRHSTPLDTPPAALIQSLLPIWGGRIDIKISTQVYM